MLMFGVRVCFYISRSTLLTVFSKFYTWHQSSFCCFYTRAFYMFTAVCLNKICIYCISVIPKLWPAGHFWPAASYKMAREDLWSSIFYLHHITGCAVAPALC